MTDLYAILGVSPRATSDELRRAYRKNAIVRHRDGALAVQDELHRMRDAFTVLVDPERRRLYDALRAVERGRSERHMRESLLLLEHVRATAADSERLSRDAVDRSSHALLASTDEDRRRTWRVVVTVLVMCALAIVAILSR